MTVTIVHEAAALIAAVPSKDARTTEEEEAVGTAKTIVMTRVQGETVRITPIDAMMTTARMVARDVVVLTVLRCLM
jgi:hypothetical protein